MKITSQKFPLDLPFIAYLLKWNYEKSAKCNPTFLQSKFFSIPKYRQVSKYAAMLSKFSFPKKGNKSKSNFQMANLCNGGTKDFVELQKIVHLLNIRTQLTQSITVKPVQMTTSVKRPMLSPPKQIPIKSLLFNKASDHFFDTQMKKKWSKTTTTKLYSAKECKKT